MGTLYAKSGTSSFPQYINAICDASLTIEKFVYLIDGLENKVDLAIANDISKSNVIGMLIKKPTSTTCIVQTFGNAKKSGLTSNKKIFLSTITPGEIQYSQPTGSGEVRKQLGYTYSTTELIINISMGGSVRT